ncbi:hypothetical protein ACQCT3_17890 [Sutcliffiella horikoshii]|uniref:hypothetical protein n=1 Tax=Sutcliffiella horikoshii TaxID=79883 RepID=UPI003CF2752E
MEDKDFYMVCHSKDYKGKVRIKCKPNIKLMAKAIIMVADDYLARKGTEGDKDGRKIL